MRIVISGMGDNVNRTQALAMLQVVIGAVDALDLDVDIDFDWMKSRTTVVQSIMIDDCIQVSGDVPSVYRMMQLIKHPYKAKEQ